MYKTTFLSILKAKKWQKHKYKLFSETPCTFVLWYVKNPQRKPCGLNEGWEGLRSPCSPLRPWESLPPRVWSEDPLSTLQRYARSSPEAPRKNTRAGSLLLGWLPSFQRIPPHSAADNFLHDLQTPKEHLEQNSPIYPYQTTWFGQILVYANKKALLSVWTPTSSTTSDGATH